MQDVELWELLIIRKVYLSGPTYYLVINSYRILVLKNSRVFSAELKLGAQLIRSSPDMSRCHVDV